MVPFISGKTSWNYLNGKRIIDGALATNMTQICDNEEDTAIYFDFLPYPIIDKRYKHINVFKWIDSKSKYLLISTSINHDYLYMKGYIEYMERKDKLNLFSIEH